MASIEENVKREHASRLAKKAAEFRRDYLNRCMGTAAALAETDSWTKRRKNTADLLLAKLSANYAGC